MIAEINGTSVYYEILGTTGGPVVLLHGWGCSGDLMRNLGQELAKTHRVLIPDFPGFGKSGKPPEPWGVPEYADCLKRLMEMEGWIPCSAIGHSFGCRVAAWAESQWPEMFTKMIFTGAAGLKAPQTEEGKKRAEAFQRGKQIAHKIEKIPFLREAGERMEERLRKKYGSSDYNALDAEMRQTFVRVIGLDLRDRYPLIQAPTLLIWGDADTETPLWMGQEMEKLIPDSGLVILEGGSHFAYLEQSDRFNVIARHFLTEE